MRTHMQSCALAGCREGIATPPAGCPVILPAHIPPNQPPSSPNLPSPLQKGLAGLDAVAVIVDDNHTVWPRNAANLVAVEQYHYFPSSRTRQGLHGPALLDLARCPCCCRVCFPFWGRGGPRGMEWHGRTGWDERLRARVPMCILWGLADRGRCRSAPLPPHRPPATHRTQG